VIGDHFHSPTGWTRLTNLRSLLIGVGGLYEMRPVEVDLGFLRSLPNLERLDVIDGLRHMRLAIVAARAAV
jgi:hypothetical protein